MATLPVRYPLDLSGRALSNKVTHEPYSLAAKPLRSLVPTYSPFFGNSVEIVDANGRPATLGLDYKFLDLMSVASAMTDNQLIYRTILITNAAVAATGTISYQAVGGNFQQSASITQALIDNLARDTRPPSYENILNRPAGLTPTDHYQSANTLIGLEYLVEAINTLRDCVLMGDSVGHEALYAYVDSQVNMMKLAITTYQDDVAVLALARAQNAVLAAGAAQSDLATLSNALVALQTQLSAAMSKADALTAEQAGDEARARALLAQYP